MLNNNTGLHLSALGYIYCKLSFHGKISGSFFENLSTRPLQKMGISPHIARNSIQNRGANAPTVSPPSFRVCAWATKKYANGQPENNILTPLQDMSKLARYPGQINHVHPSAGRLS